MSEIDEWKLIAALVYSKLGGRVVVTQEELETARRLCLVRDRDFMSRGIVLQAWESKQ